MKQTPKAAVCEWCQAQFVGDPRAKFCSRVCKERARQRRRWPLKGPAYKRVAHLCAHCGKSFQLKLSRSLRGSRFCSAICWHASRRAETASRPKPEPKRKRTAKNCQFCGRGISLTPGRIAVKFCSPSCRNKDRRKCFPFPCRQCGKEVTAYYASTRGRKYCSRECATAGNSGSNSAMFRGNRKHYRGNDWIGQRNLVRERDAACVGCGALPTPKEKLSVDHVVPFRLTHGYSKDVPIGPSPNHEHNLVALCRGCHTKKTHIERRILVGDVTGFRSEVKRLIPIELIDRALTLWGLM